MKTLLVLAKDSGLASALRAVLDPERYRIVAQGAPGEAEPLLRQGTLDGCIFDADLTDIRPIRAIEQFLLLLREIIGVNRAVIFLRKQAGVFSVVRGSQEDRRLRSACALGLPPGLLEHFELSLEAGIGGYVHRKGRILQSNSEGTRNDREIQKEFELLGGQVAIPILDREPLVGVAVFDGRLTGEPFANEELALIFHLLEELGLAIKNSWLYDQLLANHEMMADILNQSGNGCLVVGRELTILHANQAARDCFGRPERRGAALEFSDLPQAIGSRVFESLQSGE